MVITNRPFRMEQLTRHCNSTAGVSRSVGDRHREEGIDQGQLGFPLDPEGKKDPEVLEVHVHRDHLPITYNLDSEVMADQVFTHGGDDEVRRMEWVQQQDPWNPSTRRQVRITGNIMPVPL
jgi:hypothetical protein